MIENPTEWFHSKTIELENDLKKKGALCDMKSVVLNSERRVLNDIVRNVSVNPIFECLNTADEQNIEIICTILYELLCEMPANELLDIYGAAIQNCLSHPSKKVKGTVLKLLEKTVNDSAIEFVIKKHTPLLIDAAACLSSEERSVAQGAILLFIKIGSNKAGINALYSNPILNKLKEVMLINDTTRFRIYEIVVAVAKQSAENLSASISTDLMDKLILEISSNDILIQLVALESLTILATSNHGLTYLQEHKVIQNLVDKLLKVHEEPLSLALLPGLIEFFGNLATLQPEYFAKEYPQVMELLFNSLETTDEVLSGVIISTVGKIGSTQSGRVVLSKYDGQLKFFFKKVGQILNKKNELSVAAINSLCNLLENLNDDDNLNEISKKWFDYVNPDFLNSTVEMSKLPFLEVRLAAFALLKAISTQNWGVEKICKYPGMIEFLTDRSAEFNKDCKQVKFDIVFNLVQSSNIAQTVSEQVLHDLKDFVKEGPFYVPVQVEMATEGAT